MGQSKCRTTNGFSTTRGGEVKCCAILLSPACSACTTSLSTRLCCPEEGMEGTRGKPALTHAGKTTCPLPSGSTRTGTHTAEPWRELCQTLGVKVAGLGQLQALQMLLKNLPPFLPKTGEKDTSVGQHVCHAERSHQGVSSSLITTIVCETNLELQAALQNEKEKKGNRTENKAHQNSTVILWSL